MALDFEKICRVCLQGDKQTFDIFTSYYAKRNIMYHEMLCICTKLKPVEDDGFPRLICKDCAKLLKRTYAFNIQCDDSDQTLRSYLENQQSSVIENDIIEANSCSVKDEKENQVIKTEKNCEDDLKGEKQQHDRLFDTILEDNKNGQDNVIKSEPNGIDDGEDSGWDADDDILLEQIKSKKDKVVLELCNGVNGVKKRGRKKKIKPEELTAESKLPHQCDICGKFLSTRSNLKAHKICHTDLRPYTCSTCGMTFRGYSALFQHRKLHTGETPYHCEYCPKQFRRRTGLVNHIRIHTGEKLFSCDLCFKRFTQSAQLSVHMRRHKGDKSYLCQDCGKGFPIKADLKVHQRIHNGEKPYNCPMCEKTFATSGNLSIHVRIHNKEIRYNCKECSRGFVTCSAFNVHVKRHKGQRDYLCECGKTFYTSSALKQHKVVHTGEKKYQCKLCNKKFSQTSHLSRHFKKDHMKPDMPVPSSDYYKLVVPLSQVEEAQKLPESNVEGVKCERL